jgi:ankyrin repeat protein
MTILPNANSTYNKSVVCAEFPPKTKCLKQSLSGPCSNLHTLALATIINGRESTNDGVKDISEKGFSYLRSNSTLAGKFKKEFDGYGKCWANEDPTKDYFKAEPKVEHIARILQEERQNRGPLSKGNIAANLLFFQLIDKIKELGAGSDVIKRIFRIACTMGNVDIVRSLLAIAKDENQVKALLNSTKGNTCIHFAAGGGSAETVRLLIHHGADVNAQGEHVFGYTDSKSSPLEIASKGGYADIVQLLIKNGAKVNTPGAERALQNACKNGNPKTVRALLKAGIKPQTGMSSALRNGHQTIVKILHTAGAKVEGEDHLLNATDSGKTKLVKWALDNGAKVNPKLKTAFLSIAAKKEGPEMLDYLIPAGAELNDSYKRVIMDGRYLKTNGLRTAIECKDRAMITAFMGWNANVNLGGALRDKKGDTMLHPAAKYGYSDMVELLLNLGLDPNAKNKDGETPADYASNGYFKLVDQYSGSRVSARSRKVEVNVTHPELAKRLKRAQSEGAMVKSLKLQTIQYIRKNGISTNDIPPITMKLTKHFKVKNTK